MAQITWAETALGELDAIAEFIALENAKAASDWVRRVFRHVDQLAIHPRSGSRPPELPGSRYRQLVEPPCRIFYRCEGATVVIVHVLRFERLLRPAQLVP